MNKGLPAQFKDLERFSAWILKTDGERNHKRISSDMEEINDFYETMLKRLDDIVVYLNRFPLTEMPEDARNLFYMTMSLAEVTPAVENYKQPTVIDGYDQRRLQSVNRDPLEKN